MAIAVRCKPCGAQFRAVDRNRGKSVPCTRCGVELLIEGRDVPDFDVFVSHSSKDKQAADAVVAALECAKIRCWVAPRDISPGTDWGAAIVDAIGNSRVMVLVYTGHSNQSKQVHNEVERAFSRGLTIIPLRLEAAIPSKNMEYFISRTHWLDAMTPPLDKHLAYLVRTVRAITEQDFEEPAAANMAKSSVPSRLPPPQSSLMGQDHAAERSVRVSLAGKGIRRILAHYRRRIIGFCLTFVIVAIGIEAAISFSDLAPSGIAPLERELCSKSWIVIDARGDPLGHHTGLGGGETNRVWTFNHDGSLEIDQYSKVGRHGYNKYFEDRSWKLTSNMLAIKDKGFFGHDELFKIEIRSEHLYCSDEDSSYTMMAVPRVRPLSYLSSILIAFGCAAVPVLSFIKIRGSKKYAVLKCIFVAPLFGVATGYYIGGPDGSRAHEGALAGCLIGLVYGVLSGIVVGMICACCKNDRIAKGER